MFPFNRMIKCQVKHEHAHLTPPPPHHTYTHTDPSLFWALDNSFIEQDHVCSAEFSLEHDGKNHYTTNHICSTLFNILKCLWKEEEYVHFAAKPQYWTSVWLLYQNRKSSAHACFHNLLSFFYDIVHLNAILLSLSNVISWGWPCVLDSFYSNR